MRVEIIIGSLSVLGLALASCTVEKTRWVDERQDDEPTLGTSIATDASIDSRPPADSGVGVLRFMPVKLHSGFDGEHAFKAPVAVYDADDDLEVAAVDPSAVTIKAAKLTAGAAGGSTDRGSYFVVQPKVAGTVTLAATSKGRRAEAKLVVAEYTRATWSRGKTRYEAPGRSGEPSCAQCHVNGNAIDHSPAALASVPDATVAMAMTQGISPAGFPITVDHPSHHRWTLDDDEVSGLVTYLRALEPRGFTTY
jgi:hypothetical protein